MVSAFSRRGPGPFSHTAEGLDCAGLGAFSMVCPTAPGGVSMRMCEGLRFNSAAPLTGVPSIPGCHFFTAAWSIGVLGGA